MFHTPSPIPCPLCCPNSWGWPHPSWQSTHHSIHPKSESTPSNSRRAPVHNQVPVPCLTMHLLAWNQFSYQMHSWNMCYMTISLPPGAMTTTSAIPSARAPMATPLCWPLPLWWISVPHCCWLLLQDADHSQNPCIPMQWCKCNIYHKVAWNSYLQNLKIQNLYTLTMAHNLQMHHLLNLPLLRSLTTTLVHWAIPEVMAKHKLVWRSTKGFWPVQSVLARIPT